MKNSKFTLQDLDIISEVHGKISSSNDMILSETKHLKTSILMLKIAEANKNLSAIPVVTEELFRVTRYIRDTLQDLVNADRQRLIDATENLFNFVKDTVETPVIFNENLLDFNGATVINVEKYNDNSSTLKFTLMDKQGKEHVLLAKQETHC